MARPSWQFSPAATLHGLLILLLAGWLLSLAAPRLFANLNHRNSEDALFGLRVSGEFPSLAELDRAIGAKMLALHWLDEPVARLDQATLLLAKALREEAIGRDPAAALAAAEQALERALEMAPASHIAWNLLAQTRILQNEPAEALLAMARSYRVVPLDFDNSLSRLSLALPLLDNLDLVTVEILAEEVEAMARHDMFGLAATALATYRADDVGALLEAAEAEDELIEAYVETARKLLQARRT